MKLSRVVALTALVLPYACGGEGSGGCAGSSEIDWPAVYAATSPTPEAVRARISEAGFNRVIRALPDVIAAGCVDPAASCGLDNPNDPQLVKFYLGNAADPFSVSIPFVWSFSVRAGEDGSKRSYVGLNPNDLGSRVHVHLEDDNGAGVIWVTIGCTASDATDCDNSAYQDEWVPGHIDMTLLTGDQACFYQDNTSQQAAFTIRTMRIAIRPEIEVRADGRPYLVVDSSNVQVQSGSEIEFYSFTRGLDLTDPVYASCNCGDVPCGGDACSSCTNLSVLTGALDILFDDLIAPTLASTIVNLLSDQLTQNPLDMAGPIDLATLLPIPAPYAEPVDYLAKAHEGAPTVTALDATSSEGLGLNIDADVGFAGPYSACVPLLPEPNWDPLPMPDPGATVTAPNPVPGDTYGEPMEEIFDVAVILSDVALNRAAYEIYDAGGLCLDLPAEQIATMSNGAFVPSVGTLKDLVSRSLSALAPDEAKVDLAIAPSKPPTFAFGPGNDTPETRTSHLQITWEDVGVHLYPLVDDAKLRALAFSFDLALDLSVAPTPEGNIQFFLDDFNPSNFVEIYNEMGLRFDPDGIGDLLGVFLPALITGEPIPFDLSSEALGLPVAPKFRGVEQLGFEGRHIGFFARLCTADDLVDPSNFLCYEGNSFFSASRTTPRAALEVAPRHGDSLTQGTALVLQAYSDIPSDELELSYRIDGFGLFAGFTPVGADGTLSITHPLLQVRGEHTVEVFGRSRRAPGLWTNVPLVPVTVEEAREPVVAPQAPIARPSDLAVTTAQLEEPAGCHAALPALWPLLLLALARRVRRRR